MSEPSLFPKLMKGNQTGLWLCIGGGVLVYGIWQLSVMLMAAQVPMVQDVLDGPKGAAQLEPSVRAEALSMCLLLVFGFGPGLVILMVWRKLVEQRAALSLFTAKPRFRWPLALSAGAVTMILGLGLSMILSTEDMSEIQDRVSQFSVADWALLVLAYGVGISIQATFEEVFVRGWLLQHVSRVVANGALAIAITAFVFVVLHAQHPGWATLVVAGLYGLAFGWSALRLNGLEAAIGSHVGNNLLGALLAGQMITGNAPSLGPKDALFYALYVLGFLLFVEAWARFLEKPSRP